MTPGYKALHESAAIVERSDRTRIALTGEDRARLLHALTTNHIQQLLPGHGCYAFFLNAQGRITSDANIFAFADHLLIDAEPEVRHSLFTHIDHYIIADDVTLDDQTETTFCLDILGPAAHTAVPVPSAPYEHDCWHEVTIANIPGGVRIFGPPERKQPTLDLLYLPTASPSDAETYRIEQRIPRFGADITPRYLSGETGITKALHFQKGCYLGQEIVERVRSRGHVNRRLVALNFDSPKAPEPGAKLTADEKEIGEVTSAASSPAMHHTVGFAYVRVPFDTPGSKLQIDGQTATVV